MHVYVHVRLTVQRMRLSSEHMIAIVRCACAYAVSFIKRSIMDRRRLCPHCDESVSLKTYKAHRRMYYDSSNDRWSYRQRFEEHISSSDSDNGMASESPPHTIGEIRPPFPDSPVCASSFQGMKRGNGYS